MNTSEITTIIVALAGAGVFNVLIELWRNQRKDKAEARLAVEQAESVDILQAKERQNIIGEWERRYGDLVARLDAERDLRTQTQQETRVAIAQLQHDLDVKHEQWVESEKRAARQACLLIEFESKCADFSEQIKILTADNVELRHSVAVMQHTISEQAVVIHDLQAKLTERDARIVELTNS